MGHFRQKVEKTDLYTSTLALCKAGTWSQKEMKRMAQDKYADPVKITAKVLTDAFQRGRDIGEVNTLLQCFSKVDYLFGKSYRQAELFYSLFKNSNSKPEVITSSPSWKTDLTPLEQHAAAFLFSVGFSQHSEDFAWGIRYTLGTRNDSYNYAPLISFLGKNYFPSSLIINADLIPRNQICGRILGSEFSHNLSPMDETFFSDDFCPELAAKRLETKKAAAITSLYNNDIKDEKDFLPALRKMVPNPFEKGSEIIPYAIKATFRGGIFFEKIKSDQILADVLDFLSSTWQERVTYIIWSRSRNSQPLLLLKAHFNGVSISTLLDELTNYLAASASTTRNPSFRIDTKKDYFKKIYESLPKAERAGFLDQVATEYLAKIKSDPDRKLEIKKEGIALLDSLYWWNPKYVDDAIKKLKA